MFLGIVLFIIALIGALGAFRLKMRAKSQSTWPCVSGHVTRSVVELTNVFWSVVEYQYAFDGKLFRGDKVCTLAIGVVWPGPATRTVERYPVGSAVNVYVDPKNPSNTVLEPGGDPKFLPFSFTFSAIVIFVAIRFLQAAAR